MPDGRLQETVVVKPHPGGRRGAMMSLDEVAKRGWAARLDPRVRAWATQQIAAAGGSTSTRERVAAMGRAYRKKVPYIADPVQAEFIASPRQLLCLDDHGLCIVGGDCDEATVTGIACCLSIGIPSKVVGASYSGDTGQPTHVYFSFLDDDGQWCEADWTTDKAPASSYPAARKWLIDPQVGVGADGQPGGDFVGVHGRPSGGGEQLVDELAGLHVHGRELGLGALVVTAEDLAIEQARVLATATGIDTAASACTTIDTTTKAEWDTYYAALKDFCTRPTCNFWYPGMPSNCIMATASAGDTLMAYEASLQLWQTRLATPPNSCANLPPALVKFQPSSPLPSESTLAMVLTSATVIVAVGGGAYILGRFIPQTR